MAAPSTNIPKPTLSQVVFLLTSSLLLRDGVVALTPQYGTSQLSAELQSIQAVLPPFPGVSSEKTQTKSTRTDRQNGKAKKKPWTEKFSQHRNHRYRHIPENIPSLSELFQGDDGMVSTQTKSARTGMATRGSGNSMIKARHDPSSIDEDQEPWKASFRSSVRTQGRIKKEFTTFYKGEALNQKAKRILNALLSTPPHHCNAANVVGALTMSAKALGSRRIEHDEQLRTLLFETLDVLHLLVKQRLLTTRQLCNACWAIAKHYDRDNSLLPSPPESTALSTTESIGTAIQWEISGQSNDVLSENQQKLDETIDEIARQLTSILEQTDSFPDDASEDSPEPAKIGEICMASWAYGKLRPRSTPPGWEIPPRLGKIPSVKNTASQVARTANLITFEQWGSFGTKKQEDNNFDVLVSTQTAGYLFDAIAVSLCSNVGDQGHFDLTQDDAIFEDRLQACSWSELANVGWSFASHGRCKTRPSEMLLQALAQEACRRLQLGGKLTSDFLIRDIAQLMWALGTLQADNFRLADDLVYLVESLSDYLRLGERSPSFGRGRPLARWSCADLVQVALSLAHARIDELPLLRAIYEESHHRLLEGLSDNLHDEDERRCFRPWEVSILLWALARLNLRKEQDQIFEEFVVDAPRFLLSTLSAKTQKLSDCGIGAQEQANIAWSLTVLEEHQSSEAITLLNRIFHEAAQTCHDQHTIQLEHAHQLWQAYFLLEDESPESVANVPAWFADYLRDKWNLEKARDKLSSARHKSLSQTLDLMGVRHFNEHDEDIDVAIVLKGDASWTHEADSGKGNRGERVLVAVEFDGPNHFTREQSRIGKGIPPRALGHTVLKYRLLKKQGWTVVRVPYFEFDKIPFWASMERQRYLQRKLKTHANIKFSEIDVSEYKSLQPNRKSRFD